MTLTMTPHSTFGIAFAATYRLSFFYVLREETQQTGQSTISYRVNLGYTSKMHVSILRFQPSRHPFLAIFANFAQFGTFF